MQRKKLEERKKKLIEKLGAYLEDENQVPPLAARIIAYLIIQHDCGITFDQLVNDLGASKSTISTHLNNLIAQKRVDYFTKTGDRKRYYIISSGHIIRKIAALVLKWEHEIDLRKEVLKYKEDYNKLYQTKSHTTEIERAMLHFLEESVVYFRRQIKKHKSQINDLTDIVYED